MSQEIDTALTSIVNRTTTVNGKLKIFNTINEFNVLDKNKFLNELGNEVTIFLNSCIDLILFFEKTHCF